uniref:EF-hand domain-containing protein n=1 Tax=Trichuris muris TaxID=70415 RepID=A0A5S6QJL0_TRIMR
MEDYPSNLPDACSEARCDVILEEVTSVFNYFSDDGGTSIPFDQVGTVLRVLGRAPTEEQVNILCDGARLPDSKMYLSEFIPILSIMADVEESISVENLVHGLSQFDDENDGCIKAAKLRHLLSATGEKFTDQEVDDLLRDQEDSNGNVDILKFVRHIMNC